MATEAQIKASKLRKGYSVPFHLWHKLQVHSPEARSNPENRRRWAMQKLHEEALAINKARDLEHKTQKAR